MRCDRCAGERFTKAGRDRFGRQLHRCAGCGRRLTARTGSASSGYRFPEEVIALAVRWYLRYRLSYAEVTGPTQFHHSRAGGGWLAGRAA